MAKRVEIDKSLCIGCGACESACPDVFEIGEDGKAHVKKEVIEDQCCDLADIDANCPAQAITITDK